MEGPPPPIASEPPAYVAAGDSSIPSTTTGAPPGTASPDTILKPTTLYVAERFIHTADPHAPPAYEFSHSINFLSGSDRKVTLDRLDYTIRTNPSSGAPTVNTRKRNLFELTHRTTGELPNFVYQAEAKSRVVLGGSMGIEQKRRGFTRKVGYRVCKAVWGPDRRLTDTGETVFQAAQPSNADEVSWEWSDGEGCLVAREVMNDMLASLVITAEMTQARRDALVAAWILRLWWDLAEGKLQARLQNPQTLRKRAFPTAGGIKLGMHNSFGGK